MKYDPVRLELIKNALASVVDEMLLTVVRVAYSSILKDTMDVSSAFFDREGNMIAQGLSLPIHLGSFPDAMAAVRQEFGDDIRPGDVIILNDPYHGGMHLPDIFLFRPIFIDDHLLGYVIIVAHHNDIGGRVPGSSAADSTEIFQEGLRIPPLKLFVAGRPNEAIFRLIAINVRTPDTVLGDLNAQISACITADKAMRELVKHYGLAELQKYFAYLLDYSESEARRTIRTIPDGIYRYIDYLDDDGITFDQPVRIQVSIEVRGEELTVDFEGTSPQVSGAINATLSFAKSSVYFAVRSIMDSDAPSNTGFFRPISVKAPEGCLVNPNPPAAVAARGVTGFRVIDALFGALAQAVPERVRAAGEGGTTSYSIASYDADGRLILFREAVMGAWGAGFLREGIDGVANPAANISNAPIELVENQVPVRIERYELVPDSGGAGRWRGGMSVERQLCFLANTVTVQLRSDRHNHPPYGLRGGLPGAGSANHVDKRQGWVPIATKFILTLKCGDRLRHRTAGGGGFGHPFERPPERVLNDVWNGKVTVERALEDYGVSILTNPFRIDWKTTQWLRRNRVSPVDPVCAR